MSYLYQSRLYCIFLRLTVLFPAHRDKGAFLRSYGGDLVLSLFKNLLGSNLTEHYRPKRKTRQVVKDGVVCLRAGGG